MQGVVVAAPSQTRDASRPWGMWQAFDLADFVQKTEAALGARAHVDRSHVVVLAHSGGGCNVHGSALAAASARAPVPYAVVLADTCFDRGVAETTARRVLNAVALPSNREGAQFTLTCSIGVALAPSHGRTADELIRHGEAAMRAVKSAGRANYRVHEVRTEVDRRSHMQLDHAMRQALVSGRFRLHYQPQVNLEDGRVTGAEALLRWRDATALAPARCAARRVPTNPGSIPEGCVACKLRRVYDPAHYLTQWDECRAGERGCGQSKKELTEIINESLAPIRARRAELESNPGYVAEVLRQGAKTARAAASETMTIVRKALLL